MVEYQLPKLATGVRFPSLAPIIFILLICVSGCRTADTAGSPYKIYDAVAPRTGGTYHYVKGGETLWAISKLYDVDIAGLVAANNLDDSRVIERGQKLLIPGAAKRRETQYVSHSKESFVWPLKGSVSAYYGSKTDKVRNKGIDIRASEGANVRAAKSGKVVFCDEWLKGFGKTVILDHGNNFQTVYSYNSALLVKIGDTVEQNSVIAKAGRSGRAKEPSLHFEIRRNGEPQNPFYYLSY